MKVILLKKLSLNNFLNTYFYYNLVCKLIIYKYFEQSTYDVVMVKSNINGKSYLVRNLPDKQEAADLLGKISVKLEKLVNIIKTQGYETIYSKYMKNDVVKETTNPDKYKKDLIQGQEGGSSDSQQLEKQIKTKLNDFFSNDEVIFYKD